MSALLVAVVKAGSRGLLQGSRVAARGLVPPTRQLSRDLSSSEGKNHVTSLQSVISHQLSKKEKRIQDTVQSGLQSVDTLSGVLKHVESTQNLQPLEACVILLHFCRLCDKLQLPEQEVLELLDNADFAPLTHTLHQRVTDINQTILLNTLSSLLKICSTDIFLIESLERQVLWLLKKMPISQVFKVIEVHGRHQETKIRQEVHAEALKVAERRWTEISNPKDLISLMYHAIGTGNTDILEKLEDKALDICSGAGPKDLYRIFYILGRARRRNPPLLKALAYHLGKHDLALLSPVHLTNLLFSCAVLNFVEEQLLTAISKALLSRISEFDVRLLSATVKSFGLLRWRDPALLEALCECCVKSADLCTVSPLLHTCANLDYLPRDLQANLSRVLDTLQEAHSRDPKSWLYTVWSMAVLGLLDTDVAVFTLSPEFLYKLKEKNLLQQPLIQLKLLNINAAATLELSDFPGPSLTSAFITEHKVKIAERGKKSARMGEIMESLDKFAPEKCRAIDISTDSGYKIDIELLVNSKGELQPLPESEEATPGGEYTKLAVKVLGYDDLSRCTPAVLGHHAMAARHLTKSGYKVLQIHFSDFKLQDSTVKKVQFLQSQILKALK